jgi:outer membrane protein assembly factor BamD (BamD/ComL family)
MLTKNLFVLILLNFFGMPLFAQNLRSPSTVTSSGQLKQIYQSTHDDQDFNQYFKALLKERNKEEAEALLKNLLKHDPKNSKYLTAQGLLFKEIGKSNLGDKSIGNALNNLPKDEFKIRQLANFCYQVEAYDLTIAVFLQGRKALSNEQAFVYELLRIYQARRNKVMLVEEYLNAFETMPELLQSAESAFASIFDTPADYTSLQNALFKKIQKDPAKEVYTQLLIWQFLQQQEYDMALRQLIAQDKRLKDDGGILFNTIETFTTNGDFNTAMKAYEYILTKGSQSPYYIQAKVELINIHYKQLLEGTINKVAVGELASQYLGILKDYGKNAQTLFALKKWAYLQAYYLGNANGAKRELEAALLISGLPPLEIASIKLDLGDIYVLTNQPWDAILSYEQVTARFEGQPIANEARFRTARLSFYQGNFLYAKSQADVLKASTSQLIANDALDLSLLISDNLQDPADSSALRMYADAELLEFKNQSAKALIKLDSITIKYPANSLADDVLYFKSRIYIKTNNYAQAAVALKELIAQQTSSIWADDALFTLADLQEKKLNDPEQAKILYQKLLTDFPGSMHIAEARKRFRKLRGDNMGA